MIVDETFVKNFRLGDRVIGRQIDIGDGTQGAEIIGVVKGIRRVGMAEAPRGDSLGKRAYGRRASRRGGARDIPIDARASVTPDRRSPPSSQAVQRETRRP